MAEMGDGTPGMSGGDPGGNPGGEFGGDPASDPGKITDNNANDPNSNSNGSGPPSEGDVLSRLPSNFDSMPNEIKFKILESLSLQDLNTLSGTSTLYRDVVLSYLDHLLASKNFDAAELGKIRDISPVFESRVLMFVAGLVASDQLVYPISGESVRDGTFPGEDWIEPFDFNDDPESTLAVWQRGYIRRK